MPWYSSYCCHCSSFWCHSLPHYLIHNISVMIASAIRRERLAPLLPTRADVARSFYPSKPDSRAPTNHHLSESSWHNLMILQPVHGRQIMQVLLCCSKYSFIVHCNTSMCACCVCARVCVCVCSDLGSWVSYRMSTYTVFARSYGIRQKTCNVLIFDFFQFFHFTTQKSFIFYIFKTEELSSG